MVSIHISYSKTYRTFTVEDNGGNHVNFQTMQDGALPPPPDAISHSVRPMQALLMALGTCSGIDIVAILDKQRQAFDDFSMTVTGERAEGVIPSVWVKAHVDFILSGNLDSDKVQRAADLSIEKYCSVAETLRRAGCTITYAVVLRPVQG